MPPGKKKKVAIIIVNYNSVKETLRCLESLEKVEDQIFSVVVVDNASRDDSLSELRQWKGKGVFPMAFTASPINRGFGGGNNIAIRKLLADSQDGLDHILLLNPDTVVSPDFLRDMVETIESDEKIAMVGALIYKLGEKNEQTDEIFFAGGEIKSGGMRAVHVGIGKKDSGQHGTTPYDTEFVTGACLLVKRKALSYIGLIDEDYFLYYEDVDWSQRAIKEGWKCVVDPRAHIWHEVSVSTNAGSESYIYYHVRNGFVAGVRWGCTTCVKVRSILIALKQLPKLLIPGKYHRWGIMALMGLWDAWRGRMGPFMVEVRSPIFTESITKDN